MRNLWRYLVRLETILWATICANCHWFLLLQILHSVLFLDPSEWQIHQIVTEERGFSLGSFFVGFKTERIVCTCGRVFYGDSE